MSEVSSPEEPTAERPLMTLILNASVKEDEASFDIAMKTILPQFTTKETTVTRNHSDFEWLYRQISNEPKYSGLVIPPCPPKPNFTIDQDSIAFFSEDENADAELYQKMKLELEREYLAFFKKAVFMHNYFLDCLSLIPSLRVDHSFIVFLTCVESLNSKTTTGTYVKDFFRFVKKSVDENIVYAFSGVTEPDRFFEEESHYLSAYSSALKNTVYQGDTMTKTHRCLTNMFIKLHMNLTHLTTIETAPLSRILEPLAIYIDRIRKVELRVSTDEDLKLTDTLRFHQWNAEACKALMLRRIKSYIASQNAYKALQKAQTASQNLPLTDPQHQQVAKADAHYQQSLKEFSDISDSAKAELAREARERLASLNKNLTAYCELQISHIKTMIKDNQSMIERLWAEEPDAVNS